MGIISNNNRQLKLYYNSETSLGKQTKAYINISKKKTLTFDISKTKVSGTQWLEIVEKLNIHISKLVNQKHPDFVKIYGNKEVNLTDEDWLNLIEKQPIIVTYPIIISGMHIFQIKTPSDFMKYLGKE